MWKIAIVAGAGSIGAAARYLVGLAVQHLFGDRIGWATMTVNTLGCLAVGFAMHQFLQRQAFGEGVRLAIVAGFLGAFTTYSAFGFDALTLARERGLPQAGLYIALTLILGMAGVWLGWAASSLASA